MPFTLSHPAAVLPLVREPFVPAALVVGAMAPDVPYFVPVPRYAGAWYEPFVNATVTHQWPGMLTVAVPTAAVLLGLWWIVRSPLVDLVLRRRGEPVPSRSGADTGAAPRLRAVAWLVASLVLGVLTHVVWDSFTHADGLAVEQVAFLRAPAVAGMDVARVLQHVSTVVGGVILVAWAWRRIAAWRAQGGRLDVTRSRAGVLAGLVVVVVLGAVVGIADGLAEGAPLEALLVDLVTAAGTAVALAVLAYAGVWHAVARRG